MNRISSPVFLLFLISLFSVSRLAAAQQIEPGDVAQTIGRVNVRESPATSSPIVVILEDAEVVTVISVVPAGQVVTVEDITSSLWYQIQTPDGSTGYVWYGLLEQAVSPTSSPTATATVSADVLGALSAAGISPESGYLAERLPDREFRFEGGSEAADNVDFVGSYADFVLATTIQWGPEPENSRCGVYFRQSGGGGSDAYYLILLPDQNLNFAAARGGNILDTDRSFSDVMRIEPNATNVMLVVAVKSTIAVYINGQFAAVFQDNSYHRGEAGLAGLTLDADGQVSCRFSNSWLWQFTGEVILPSTPTLAPSNIKSMPTIANQLEQVGIDPENGQLAFQQPSVSISGLTDEADEVVNKDFSGRYENFVLKADILWGPGGSTDLCGVYFGSRGAGELRGVMINQRQQLILGTTRLGIAGADNVSQRAHAIRVGPDAVNQLMIVVDNKTFSVYLNGEYLAQFEDETYQSGIVGAYAVRRSQSVSSGCDFRNLWLWELNEPLPVIPSPTPAPEIVPSFITDALASVDIDPDVGNLDRYYTQIRLTEPEADSDVYIDGFAPDYRNFVIGTDFTWEPGAGQDDCGFTWRQHDSDLYLVNVGHAGIRYSIAANDLLYGMVPLSDAIPSADSVNSLMLVAVNDVFSFYMNGQYIGQFQDDRHPDGKLSVVSFQVPGGGRPVCSFSNTWIWDLGDEGPDIPSPTPTPRPAPAPDVLEVLETLGISQDSGYVADRLDRTIIDLTGEDNIVSWTRLGEYDDFILKSTIMWGPGDVADGCGVVLREIDEQNLYEVWLTQQHRVSVLDITDNHLRNVAHYDSPMLRDGAGVSNDLWLIASGDLLTIYVNGQYVAQYRDVVSVSGLLGLLGATGFRSDESFCVFEDVWVWDLAFELPVILTPTLTPTRTPTLTPTPSLTPTPTATDTPTLTSTPIPRPLDG